MKTQRWLLALVAPTLLAGCYTYGRGTVAYGYSSPPPAPYVYVEARPGYTWVDGYYYWDNSWLWRPGYYLADRPGYYYVQGAYHGRNYRPGYWSPRQTVHVTPSRPARLYVQPQQRVAPAARPAPTGTTQRVRVVPGHR